MSESAIEWITFRCCRCGAEWEGNPGDDIDLCEDCYDEGAG